jgi:esterase/lipase superfamily enzyme
VPPARVRVVTPGQKIKLNGTELGIGTDIKFEGKRPILKDTPKTQAAFRQLVEFMEKNPEVTKLSVKVPSAEGAAGPEASRLAEARAQKVAERLAAYGVSPSRLTTGEHAVPVSSWAMVKGTFTIDEVDGTTPKPILAERIYYATDRHPVDGPDFDGQRDPDGAVHFGECMVSVPADVDHPRRPIWNVFGLLGTDQPSFGIVGIQPSDNLASLARPISHDVASGSPDEQDALVFVHGYNTTFTEACQRAGQIAYATKFHGPVFLFSWPSQGGATGPALYGPDYTNANEVSAGHFAAFLEALFTSVHPHAVHVFAHSMGCLVTVTALRQAGNATFHLGELILAAGDVDAEGFRDSPSLVSTRSDRVTIYASEHDWALWWSQFKLVHDKPRLGYEPPLSLGGWFDTIDASRVNTSPMGHSYIFERPALADVRAVLNHETPSDGGRAAWLKRVSNRAGVAWYELPR